MQKVNVYRLVALDREQCYLSPKGLMLFWNMWREKLEGEPVDAYLVHVEIAVKRELCKKYIYGLLHAKV